MQAALRRATVVVLVGCGPGLTGEKVVEPGTIEGTVVVRVEPTGAAAWVALYAASSPPPPSGLGAPVAVVAIPEDALTMGEDGFPTGAFVFPEVPPGEYLLTGLYDVDGDFDPRWAATAGATCGDGVGGHLIDPDGDTYARVPVLAGTVTEDRTVHIVATLPVERPAFFLADDEVSPGSGDEIFRLQSTGIASPRIELAPPDAPSCGVSLVVQAMDTDGDGAIDPHPDPLLAALGALDVWPRVVVSYLGDGATPLANGESYAGLAEVDTSFLDPHTELGVPVARAEVSVFFPERILHTLPDGSVEAAERPPNGSWQVEVIQSTGQSWVVPNMTAEEPATEAFFEPALQGLPLSLW